ncbi:MAG TPA: universal stress protein [Nitrospiraceae bacterium]|nr:universal stress protein [Nitrospiraceae bacterium]
MGFPLSLKQHHPAPECPDIVHNRAFRVVAGVDWSADSLAGVRQIATLYAPDELVLVHALSSAGARVDTERLRLHVSAGRHQQMSVDAARRCLKWVSTLVQRNGSTTREICDIGVPTTVVPEAARAVGAALIVVGHRGARENLDRSMGSASHRICLNADCSTLVVRKPLSSPVRALALVQEAEDVVALERWLRLFPFKEPTDLTVLCLMPRAQGGEQIGPLSVRFWKETAVQNAQSLLNGMVHSLCGRNLRVTGRASRGNPSTIILQEGYNFDLLLLHGSDRKNRYAGRSGLPWRTLLRLAPCSTLVVRSPIEIARRPSPRFCCRRGIEESFLDLWR